MKIKKQVRILLNKLFRRYGYQLKWVEKVPSVNRERVVYQAHYCGHKFHCFKDTVIADCILRGDVWDKTMPDILGKALERKGDGLVIEVGSNVGASLLPIASKFPHAEFHLIEPVRSFFELLQKNLNEFHHPNVILHNLAIGQYSGQRLLIEEGRGNAGARLDDRKILQASSNDAHTLDDLFSGKKVSFIKIDVDGFEPQVLLGATDVLRANLPDVFVEFYLENMKKMGVDPNEVLDALDVCGLRYFQALDCYGALLADNLSKGEVLPIAESTKPYIDLVARSERL